jgi:hypothetical protein
MFDFASLAAASNVDYFITMDTYASKRENFDKGAGDIVIALSGVSFYCCALP